MLELILTTYYSDHLKIQQSKRQCLCLHCDWGLKDMVVILHARVIVNNTMGSAECSFSKLKLIKSSLGSSIGQRRLFSLAILSTENACACQRNLLDLIDNFAQRDSWERLPCYGALLSPEFLPPFMVWRHHFVLLVVVQLASFCQSFDLFYLLAWPGNCICGNCAISR